MVSSSGASQKRQCVPPGVAAVSMPVTLSAVSVRSDLCKPLELGCRRQESDSATLHPRVSRKTRLGANAENERAVDPAPREHARQDERGDEAARIHWERAKRPLDRRSEAKTSFRVQLRIRNDGRRNGSHVPGGGDSLREAQAQEPPPRGPVGHDDLRGEAHPVDRTQARAARRRYRDHRSERLIFAHHDSSAHWAVLAIGLVRRCRAPGAFRRSEPELRCECSTKRVQKKASSSDIEQ